jgi:hypothetical protein
MTQSPDTAKIPSDSWPDIQRVESFAGEIRVNLIRFAAIIIFYARHLFELWLRRHEIGMMNRYNLEVTGVVIAWLALAVVLHWDLADRKTGWWTKYIAVIWDLAMVTLLGMLATPRSSLLTLYFVIIATAPLRLSLPLVWVATIGSWIGYALVLVHYVWWFIGRDVYYSTPEIRIPRKDEAIFILALGAAGLCAGQAVRQMRRLVKGHSS